LPYTESRTPKEILKELLPELQKQAEAARFYRNYYDGIHRIAGATARFKEIFGRFFPAAADNWMQVVVDSAVERLVIQGFRFGDPDQPADEDARELWNRSRLPLRSRMGITEAVKTGNSFLLVDKLYEQPRITVESPCECYVQVDPETGERIAGLKWWIGADKHAWAYIWTPEKVYRFRSAKPSRTANQRAAYEPVEGSAPEGVAHLVTRNDEPVVPLIPVENNPDLHHGGISDLDVAIPIQDRINKLCLDLDVDSEFHAAPQRWATGWEPPTDEHGNPLPAAKIEAATSRFLAFKSEETKVGQLPSNDPSSFVDPIGMYITHLAAVTKLPPHYLLGRMANIAGEALKAAETGLVAKCAGKIIDFSDPYEEAVSLALDENPEECTSLWRNPESRTFGQLVDGVVKLRTELALPLEMGWEMIGLTPEEIARAKKLIGLPERDFRALDRGMAERQKEEQVAQAIGSKPPVGGTAQPDPGGQGDPAAANNGR